MKKCTIVMVLQMIFNFVVVLLVGIGTDFIKEGNYQEWLFVLPMILIYIPYFVWLCLTLFTDMDRKELELKRRQLYDEILYWARVQDDCGCGCKTEDSVSYWVGFKIKVEGMDKWIEIDSYNYTSNLGMAMKVASGTEDGIVGFHNKKASECLPIINKMIDEFTKHPDKYKQYEPANGWGSLQSCITFLHKLKNKCEEYPVAIVEVDY